MSALNAQDWIGHTAGSYRVLVEIGRGRRGVVFLGEHTQTGDRAAVKIFPHGPIADEVLRLATLLPRLRHPHIVRVTEAGSAGDGAFIAGELVPSPRAAAGASGPMVASSLADYLHEDAAPMDERLAIDIALDMLAALEYAHGPQADTEALPYGGLHPANILLGTAGGRMAARVAELGVPVGRERRMAADAYLSPEELQGTPATMASDVYAVGALCYLMLTAMAPPSPLVPPCLVMQDISFMWDAFMRKAMAYDCNKRFADYAEVRTALSDIRSATGKRRIWRTMRVALFTNALVGALVVAAVVIVLYYRPHHHATEPAEPAIPAPGATVGVPASPADLPAAGTDGQQGGSLIVLEKGAQHPPPPQSPSVLPSGTGTMLPGDATSILDTSSTVSLPGSSQSQEVQVAVASTTTTAVAAGAAVTNAVKSVPPVQPLPHAAVASATLSTSATATVEYIVRTSDTPWKIAKAHNMQFATFLTMNNLTAKSVIHPGQKLIVVAGGAASGIGGITSAATHEVVRIVEHVGTVDAHVSTVAASSTNAPHTHVVAKNENYYSIARKYGCDVHALQTLNTNAALKAGQTIKIPAGK